MTILIAILTIALLIVSVGWWECHKSKAKESSLLKIREDQVYVYQEELIELKASFKNTITESEDFGSAATWANAGKATSQTYRLIFCFDSNGQKILNDLEARFKRNPFHTDERETCRRLGRMEVFDFILNRINQASHPNYSEQLETAYMESNNE